MLKGKQSKMDKNKDGKISGADFKMMKDGGKNGGEPGALYAYDIALPKLEKMY